MHAERLQHLLELITASSQSSTQNLAKLEVISENQGVNASAQFRELRSVQDLQSRNSEMYFDQQVRRLDLLDSNINELKQSCSPEWNEVGNITQNVIDLVCAKLQDNTDTSNAQFESLTSKIQNLQSETQKIHTAIWRSRQPSTVQTNHPIVKSNRKGIEDVDERLSAVIDRLSDVKSQQGKTIHSKKAQQIIDDVATIFMSVTKTVDDEPNVDIQEDIPQREESEPLYHDFEEGTYMEGIIRRITGLILISRAFEINQPGQLLPDPMKYLTKMTLK